jgi:hypothetical protein
LHGEGGEDDAHYARCDVNSALADKTDQTRAQIQRDEGNKKDYRDRDANGCQLLQDASSLLSQQQKRGNRARSGEQRHSQRED